MSNREDAVLPEFQLHGDVKANIAWTVRGLECKGVDGKVPRIDVEEEGVVRSLRGTGNLGKIRGRIIGSDIEHFTAMSLDEQSPDSYGQVINVDPCELEFGELKYIETLHVFEPNAKAISMIQRDIEPRKRIGNDLNGC